MYGESGLSKTPSRAPCTSGCCLTYAGLQHVIICGISILFAQYQKCWTVSIGLRVVPMNMYTTPPSIATAQTIIITRPIVWVCLANPPPKLASFATGGCVTAPPPAYAPALGTGCACGSGASENGVSSLY